jgi:hypothetical protein
MMEHEMKNVSSADARTYVAGVELPPPPRVSLAREAAEPLKLVKDKTQALVVGSDVMSFVQGVTPERRQDLVNASLLAQLVATKRVPDPTGLQAWYDAYFEVLTNLGFAIQDRQFAEYTEKSADFEAHEAIINIAATLLGGAPTALALVKTTLEALKTDGPWLTLFTRESQSAKTAKFQVTLAEPGEGDQFLVSLMAFALTAQANLTQLLVFKVRSNGATLKHVSGKVTINPEVLASVRDDVSRRLEKYAKAYVESLPEL